MIKKLQTFLFVVAAFGLLSSCMKDSNYQMPGETYVVSQYNLGGTYFIDDLGNKIIPRNSQNVESWQIPSDKRLLMIYSQDQDSWNEANKTWNVEVVGLYYVPEVHILPATTDTLGTDPLYYAENSYAAWIANGFLTTRFLFQHSGSEAGAKKHTFGLAEDPLYGEYSGNDTLRLLLWHNAHQDLLQTGSMNHNCVRLTNYPWSSRDSVVLAIRYITDETVSYTMYAKYKRSSLQ